MSKLDGSEVGFHIVRQSQRCIGPTGSIDLSELANDGKVKGGVGARAVILKKGDNSFTAIFLV